MDVVPTRIYGGAVDDLYQINGVRFVRYQVSGSFAAIESIAIRAGVDPHELLLWFRGAYGTVTQAWADAVRASRERPVEACIRSMWSEVASRSGNP